MGVFEIRGESGSSALPALEEAAVVPRKHLIAHRVNIVNNLGGLLLLVLSINSSHNLQTASVRSLAVTGGVLVSHLVSYRAQWLQQRPRGGLGAQQSARH